MPRPAGRAILLKFRRKDKIQQKNDPVATFGQSNAFSGYPATTKGKERRHANEYHSLHNALVNAWKDKGYSDAKLIVENFGYLK